MGKEMKIPLIENGTVIDHITARQVLNVLKILRINTETDKTVEIVMNVQSKKMGRKDIVKAEDRELRTEEVDKIALIAPNATISIIRDSEVIAKHKVKLPKTIKEIIKCVNPNCISNAEKEPIVSEFTTIDRSPPQFRCLYCGRIIGDVAHAMFS